MRFVKRRRILNGIIRKQFQKFLSFSYTAQTTKKKGFIALDLRKHDRVRAFLETDRVRF